MAYEKLLKSDLKIFEVRTSLKKHVTEAGWWLPDVASVVHPKDAMMIRIQSSSYPISR